MLNLSEQIGKYIDNCDYMKGLSNKTIKAYTIDLNQYNVWWCEKDEWYSKQTVENYIVYVYKKFMPRSAKRKIATLKAFFHYLEIEEVLSTSPFHKIEYKRREATILPRTIPANTIAQILTYAYFSASIPEKSEYYYRNVIRDIAVLELLFSSGVRVGELCLFEPDAIDLKDKIIRVNGKGLKERYIHLTNSGVINALKKYRHAFADDIKNCGYFFVNNRGDRLSEQSVRFMVDK